MNLNQARSRNKLKDPEDLKEIGRIEEIARVSKPTVMAVGIGGAGCNVISWVKEKGVAGGKLVSVNTDANHLKICRADTRILIGEKTCRGQGCGGYPKVGERAMQETLSDVIEEVSDANIIFLVAGMGGGTGTGGICALAEELRSLFEDSSPHLIIGVVTLPFQIETARLELAKEGANDYGFEIITVPVTNASEVLLSTQVLINKNIDAIYQISDNTINAVFEAVGEVASENGVPLFGGHPYSTRLGACAALGWDFSEMGYKAGRIAIRVKDGEDPADIPFLYMTEVKLSLNLEAAQNQGIFFSEDIRERADEIFPSGEGFPDRP